MSVYTNSRYSKIQLRNYEGNLIYERRKRVEFSTKDAKYHIFASYDRLDLLAEFYYGDKQLWWVFLDANPKYRSEMDIKFGDALLVPTYEEVSKWV